MSFPFYSTVAPPPPPPHWNLRSYQSYLNVPPPPNLPLQIPQATPIAYQNSCYTPISGFQIESNFAASSNQTSWNITDPRWPTKTEVTEINTAVELQHERDQSFVSDFVMKRMTEKSNQKRQSKIHATAASFRQVIQLINRVRASYSMLTTNEHKICNEDITETKIIMETIKNIVQQFTTLDFSRLKKVISKRKAKRKRLQILKSEKRKWKADQAEHLRTLHEKIDAWQNSFKQELKTAEMEKKMKQEADMILSEVRRKKAEANKLLSMIESTEKLRSIKKEIAQKRSLYTPTKSDEQFQVKMSLLKETLNSRLSDYEEEEKTLQVMLSEEHQETRNTAKNSLKAEFSGKVNAKRKEEMRCLFGPEEINVNDSSYYWTFYNQANRDLDTLIEIRRKWDSWVVPCDTPYSSGIPLDWILPIEPSSKEWAKYLAE